MRGPAARGGTGGGGTGRGETRRRGRCRPARGQDPSSGIVAPVVLAAVLAVTAGCGTTLPLESYETATDLPTHPTVAYLDAPRDDVWSAILDVLRQRDEETELIDPDRGRITTGWTEAPSLIHSRRRLGERGEDASLPLPARYRLLIRVSRIDERTRVEVDAEEETNFLILTGTDPQTGRSYYRDRWEPTSTRTQREHRWLQDLRQELGTGRTGTTDGAGKRGRRASDG